MDLIPGKYILNDLQKQYLSILPIDHLHGMIYDPMYMEKYLYYLWKDPELQGALRNYIYLLLHQHYLILKMVVYHTIQV